MELSELRLFEDQVGRYDGWDPAAYSSPSTTTE